MVFELESCISNIKIHYNNFYWLGDFVSLLSQDNKQHLLALESEYPIKTRLFKSKEEYASKIYSIKNPKKITNEKFADLVSTIIDCYSMETEHESPTEVLLKYLDVPLANPKVCAGILSRQSFLEISQYSVESHAKELENVLKTRKWDQYNNQDPFIRENWKIIELFLTEIDGNRLREHLDYNKDHFNYLFNLARVKERHKLFATRYVLYIPPHKTIRVADPIEQIIVESTKNPKLIYGLNSREFERFLAKIFESFGFEVQITAQTRDGGADLICLLDKKGVLLKVAVEAKRYKPSRPVTVELVRSFVGANEELRANKLVYVTTSRYTRDAMQYAQSPGLTHLLELKKMDDVIRWSQEYTPNHRTIQDSKFQVE